MHTMLDSNPTSLSPVKLRSGSNSPTQCLNVMSSVQKINIQDNRISARQSLSGANNEADPSIKVGYMSAHTLQKGELEPALAEKHNVQSGATLNRSNLMPQALNLRGAGSNRVSYKDMVNVQMRMRRMRTSTNVLASPRGDTGEMFPMSQRTAGFSDVQVAAATHGKHPMATFPHNSSAGMMTPTYASNEVCTKPGSEMSHMLSNRPDAAEALWLYSQPENACIDETEIFQKFVTKSPYSK